MDNSRANSLNHAPISSRFVFFPFDLLLKLNKARGIQTDFFSVSKNFCIGCFGNERRERSIGTIGRERASKERERERTCASVRFVRVITSRVRLCKSGPRALYFWKVWIFCWCALFLEIQQHRQLQQVFLVSIIYIYQQKWTKCGEKKKYRYTYTSSTNDSDYKEIKKKTRCYRAQCCYFCARARYWLFARLTN